MADADLRGLERRYRETGAVEDHARWLAARVRAGELGEHRARLAAELGHAAAGRALGVAPRPLDQLGQGLRDAAALSRLPAANADARWILTGRAPDFSGTLEPSVDEEAIATALREALRALTRARVLAGGEEPLLTEDADGLHVAVLSTEQVLSCFPAPARPRIADLIAEVRRGQVLLPAEDDAAPGAGAPDVELRWFDPSLELGLPASATPAARLARELHRTPRGLDHLAWSSWPWLLPRVAGVAAEVLGDAVVRDALVGAVAGALLRE